MVKILRAKASGIKAQYKDSYPSNNAINQGMKYLQTKFRFTRELPGNYPYLP